MGRRRWQWGRAWYFAVYINGQLPTAEQAAQITWNSNGVPGMVRTEGAGVLGPQSPLGAWVIDANGAANTAVGTHTLVATYQGVSASFTFTRLPPLIFNVLQRVICTHVHQLAISVLEIYEDGYHEERTSP